MTPTDALQSVLLITAVGVVVGFMLSWMRYAFRRDA